MRHLFLILALLLASVFYSHAQIAPPKQTDTLIINSVKYNYANIDKANWPCEVIYKSTRDIRIGHQTFNILEAYKPWDIIHFKVYDTSDSSKKEYVLDLTENIDETYTLTFSGYEFICHKKGYEPSSIEPCIDDSSANLGSSIKSYTLNGRNASYLKIPTCRCNGEGEVTVIISVNPAGQVINAEVKDDISSTDDCLRSFAIRAARLSRFSAKSGAKDIELGEIVYNFSGNKRIISETHIAGEPHIYLSGRSVNGTLPKPVCSAQTSGKVVVKIWVDNYGTIQKAETGVEGTTIQDKTVWQNARKAALRAHFNMDSDAPALQEGTITYVF